MTCEKGHKLYPIMINGRTHCLVCEKRMDIKDCTEAEIKDAENRADKEFPPMKYSDPGVPAKYKCGKCGVSGIRLWREAATFSPDIFCATCGCEWEKVKPEFDENGKLPGLCGPGDHLGNLVPAVPDEEGLGYWGYTSVPKEGCDWWYALPIFPPPVKKENTVEPGRKDDYVALAILDFLHPELHEILNRNACASLTVCPECFVDDFTHVEGCSIAEEIETKTNC